MLFAQKRTAKFSKATDAILTTTMEVTSEQFFSSHEYLERYEIRTKNTAKIGLGKEIPGDSMICKSMNNDGFVMCYGQHKATLWSETRLSNKVKAEIFGYSTQEHEVINSVDINDVYFGITTSTKDVVIHNMALSRHKKQESQNSNEDIVYQKQRATEMHSIAFNNKAQFILAFGSEAGELVITDYRQKKDAITLKCLDFTGLPITSIIWDPNNSTRMLVGTNSLSSTGFVIIDLKKTQNQLVFSDFGEKDAAKNVSQLHWGTELGRECGSYVFAVHGKGKIGVWNEKECKYISSTSEFGHAVSIDTRNIQKTSEMLISTANGTVHYIDLLTLNRSLQFLDAVPNNYRKKQGVWLNSEHKLLTLFKQVGLFRADDGEETVEIDTAKASIAGHVNEQEEKGDKIAKLLKLYVKGETEEMLEEMEGIGSPEKRKRSFNFPVKCPVTLAFAKGKPDEAIEAALKMENPTLAALIALASGTLGQHALRIADRAEGKSNTQLMTLLIAKMYGEIVSRASPADVEKLICVFRTAVPGGGTEYVNMLGERMRSMKYYRQAVHCYLAAGNIAELLDVQMEMAQVPETLQQAKQYARQCAGVFKNFLFLRQNRKTDGLQKTEKMAAFCNYLIQTGQKEMADIYLAEVGDTAWNMQAVHEDADAARKLAGRLANIDVKDRLPRKTDTQTGMAFSQRFQQPQRRQFAVHQSYKTLAPRRKAEMPGAATEKQEQSAVRKTQSMPCIQNIGRPPQTLKHSPPRTVPEEEEAQNAEQTRTELLRMVDDVMERLGKNKQMMLLSKISSIKRRLLAFKEEINRKEGAGKHKMKLYNDIRNDFKLDGFKDTSKQEIGEYIDALTLKYKQNKSLAPTEKIYVQELIEASKLIVKLGL